MLKLFTYTLLLLLVISANSVLAIADTTYYVYVSMRGDNIVSLYKVNKQSGSLTKVYDQTVIGGPASLALHPTKNYLYVAQRSAKTISSYSIDKTTGKLTLINTIIAVDNPVYISTDKTGSYLLSAYYSANKAAVYSINPNGSLNETYIWSINTDVNPHAINTDPTNHYLYITNMTGNKILQYRFNETSGEITTMSPSEVVPPAGTCPRHFVFHGTKKIMYVVNEVGNTVTAYSINETSGVLDSLQTISTLPPSFTGTNKCADIHITPDNGFLYASNRGHESIAAFSISPSNGTLSEIDQYFTGTTPREFDIDPTGSYLYAAGETSNNLTYYKINKTTGVMDSITTYSVGTTPSWVLAVGFVNNITNTDVLKSNDFKLANFPNPFHASTSIQYFLPEYSDIKVRIFDVSGKLVSTLTDGKAKSGYYSFEWHGKNTYGSYVHKGIYFCRIDTDYGCNIVKMVYIH
jgi:6-phosphogluconolactonase